MGLTFNRFLQDIYIEILVYMYKYMSSRCDPYLGCRKLITMKRPVLYEIASVSKSVFIDMCMFDVGWMEMLWAQYMVISIQ